MPTFICSLAQKSTPLPHVWEHTVGSCHAPLALRADWQAQLRRCHDELGFRYVRFHGLLSDDMGPVVRNDGAARGQARSGRRHRAGRLFYFFFNADRICDYLLAIGMKPFVELSFMPEALASGSKTVFHYRGNVTPPRSYREWGALVGNLVAHWVERYGAREVGRWFFEVWNEPNLKAFWKGSRNDYFELYRHTARALKAVDPSLKVGGPASAKNEWIEELLDFCERNDLPADFVSTHHYPTDAFGSESDDTEIQLSQSRRSVLREQAQDARRRARGRPLYYTEWNTSSNSRDPLHDEPYAAAFVAKTALEAAGVVEGYSFWTFSDIFEENYFPSVPYHGGFGLLNLHGIPKPTYRAFQLLHELGTERLMVDGLHATVDAWVVRRRNQITVLLTNHALPRHPIQTEQVHVSLTDAPEPTSAHLKRIDEDHANAKCAWREAGQPEHLTARDVERLEEASTVRKEPIAWRYDAGTIGLELALPPHAVAALILRLASEAASRQARPRAEEHRSRGREPLWAPRYLEWANWRSSLPAMR